MLKEFVHLHTHSHYSLLDGLAKIDELIAKAKGDGMKSLALTDHGALYGAIEFYQKCEEAGIKPIIGQEMYIAPYGTKLDEKDMHNRYHHLILLAETTEGYNNLIKLTTIAHLEGYYYKPRIDWEVLEKHKKGLIALSACLGGEIADAILNRQNVKAKELAETFSSIMGKNNFFLEMQPHDVGGKQKIVNIALKKIARDTGIPLVGTNDSHYLNPEDDQAHDILICLGTKRKKAEKDRLTMLGENFSFKLQQEMIDSFSDCPEAVANTVAIAKRCDVKIPLGQIVLPEIETPGNKDPHLYLAELCKEGLATRYTKPYSKEVRERLEYELSVIKKMEFSTYFLVVRDFVHWAKEHGIIVGPARGSAASSIVSYLLGITSIDPLHYNLLFERFLNPERISPPDFDIDFADVRRDEVIAYVEEKYGKDHVAQVITFGTMAARAAIRDVGRVMGLSYSFCDQIAKLIPMFSSLTDALKIPELKEIYENNEEAKVLIDYAKKLEGVARHTSTHACAVLIVPKPLTTYTPVQHASSDDSALVSQYSLHPVEDLGLLKIDFLGLKNLTIIETAIEIISKIHGKTINTNDIPLDDKKTFTIFQKGLTTGVFQLESSGMKRYLKQLVPTDIEDIIAMISLYRPGPMELIHDYIAGKHGTKKIHYLVPELKPILEVTYGIAVYQEQVIQMARTLANFSYAEADVLRKAVGKKIKNLLDEQKTKMIQRMIENKIDARTADMIWQFIEPFARYGFNRAHAAGYAMIAYQTAYFKAHYPVEFMASLMTADHGDTDRIAFLVEEALSMGIEVLPPDVNESFSSFTVVAESLKIKTPRIRFGLLGIKNVGSNVIKELIKERKEGGSFKNVEDFLERVHTKDMNKKSLESLIKSGAMDCFDERNKMLLNMETLLTFVRSIGKDNTKQGSLFDSADVMIPHQLILHEGVEATKKEKLSWEKELLGLYVTEHPFKEHREDFISYIQTIKSVQSSRTKAKLAIGGVISLIKRVVTKNGDLMGFVKIEDETGSIEVIVFPKVFEKTRELLFEGNLVIVIGKLSDKDGETKMLADEIAVLTDDTQNMIIKHLQSARIQTSGMISTQHELPKHKVAFSLTKERIQSIKDRLKEVFTQHPGTYPVYLKIVDEKNTQIVKERIMTSYHINFNDSIRRQLEGIVSTSGTVKLEDYNI
jgi:DNA polymerase III subunit alpha